MSSDVTVKIDLAKPVGSAGFGIPLIFSVGAAVDYTECTELAEVKTAGFDTTTNTYKAAELMLSQKPRPETIAVMGVAAKDGVSAALSGILNKSWRALVPIDIDAATLTTIAQAIEVTDDKLIFPVVADVSKLTALGTGERTIGFIHSNALANAALVGKTAAMTPGSFTYKNQILKGIDPMTYSDAQLKAIHDANGITFVEKAGDNVTSEGKTMSGEYVDIIDCKDWIINQIIYRTQKLLNRVGKVPYDNTGIAMLEAECLTVLKEAASMGMIAFDTDTNQYLYSVNYSLREEQSDTDRVARRYVGGAFTFELAGAIHTVKVNGEISI